MEINLLAAFTASRNRGRMPGLLSRTFPSRTSPPWLKIPIVITSHGGDVREGNVRLSKPGMRPRFLLAVKAASKLISIGRFTEEGFVQLSAKPEQIVSIPNGVDLEPFETRVDRPRDLDPSIHPDQFVLFIGRLANRKGIDTLVEAMANVRANETVQLVV